MDTDSFATKEHSAALCGLLLPDELHEFRHTQHAFQLRRRVGRAQTGQDDERELLSLHFVRLFGGDAGLHAQHDHAMQRCSVASALPFG